MFHSSHVKIIGGSFINNSGTFVNEWNGLTGALYESSVVNRYFLHPF